MNLNYCQQVLEENQNNIQGTVCCKKENAGHPLLKILGLDFLQLLPVVSVLGDSVWRGGGVKIFIF